MPPFFVRTERRLALALAAAAVSAPGIVAAALVISTAFAQSAVWAAAAGFAAGALLRRVDRRVAVALFAASGLAFVLASLEAMGAAEVIRGVLMRNSRAAETLAATALAPLAIVLGMQEPPRAARIAGMLLPGALVVSSLSLGMPTFCMREIALGSGGLAIVRYASRRADAAAMFTFLAVAVAMWVVHEVILTDVSFGRSTVATLLLGVCFFAGAFAASIREGVKADAGARLVIACQRRPWATSVMLASAVVALSLGILFRVMFTRDAQDVRTALLVVPAAFAMIAHLGRGGRPTVDRLAPWLAANLAAITAAGLIAAVSTGGGGLLPWILVVTVALTVWPLVAGAVLPGDPPGDATPFAAIAFTATIALFPPLTMYVSAYADVWIVTTALCLLMVPLAFHALVRTRITTRKLLVAAPFVGLLAHGARLASVSNSRDRALVLQAHEAKSAKWFLLTAGVWLAGALFVVIARRARSMTAVPRDHAIVEDFGGA